MIKNFSKLPPGIAVVLSLAMILPLPGCKPADPFITTPITGPVVIDTTEREIVFEKPFQAR
jgi:hypothetical protein